MLLKDKIMEQAAVVAYECWKQDGVSDEQKRRLIDDICASLKGALVEKYLFPEFEHCENRLRACLNHDIFCIGRLSLYKTHEIKCRAYPHGLNYSENTFSLEFPASKIPVGFIGSLNIYVRLICPADGFEDFFMYNTEVRYDRKKAVDSFDGGRLGTVNGNVTMVVKNSLDLEGVRVQLLGAMLSLVVQAWDDYRALVDCDRYKTCVQKPGTFLFSESTVKRLSKNADPCLSLIGNLLSGMADMDFEFVGCESYASDLTCPFPSSARTPDDLAKQIAKIISDSDVCMRLQELEDIYFEISDFFLKENANQEVFSAWNGCTRIKASTPQRLKMILRSQLDELENGVIHGVMKRILLNSVMNHERIR